MTIPQLPSGMPRKRLGNTGCEVSQLGYGSMGLRGPKTWGVRVVEEADAEQILHAVLDAGINLIDTAPDYGISEARIGRYLHARRAEFLLATKCGCDPVQHEDHLEVKHLWNKEVIQRNVEQSLARLRTDTIDILQFHGGDAETLQRMGLIDQLLDLKQQRIIRFLGVSTSLPYVDDLIRLRVFDLFQLPYSCLAPEHHAWITAAAESGAGIILRGGIAQGGPQAEIQRPLLNDVWNHAKLAELLPLGMKPAELILRFTLSHPHCHTTIIGTGNLAHLAENVAAAQQGPLPHALYQEIQSRVAQVLGC
jgi:aryl-alcohol dehydrogenase-like predicted oxidoreductase